MHLIHSQIFSAAGRFLKPLNSAGYALAWGSPTKGNITLPSALPDPLQWGHGARWELHEPYLSVYVPARSTAPVGGMKPLARWGSKAFTRAVIFADHIMEMIVTTVSTYDHRCEAGP